MSFRAYVDLRLGPPPAWRQTTRVLVLPFCATTFSEFWRRWNPVWSWPLQMWVYAPARRLMPRWLAVLWTFALSGGAHNLIALALGGKPTLLPTVFFLVLGLVVVMSEGFNVTLRPLPRVFRATVILLHLGVSLQLAEWLTARLGQLGGT